MQKNLTITGNVGGEPKITMIPGREFEKTDYNREIDGFETRLIHLPDREVRRFSVAIHPTDPETGERSETPVWFQVSDFHDYSRGVHKGQFVKLTGDFSTRTVEKDGKTVTYRNFQLWQPIQILRRPKPKQQAA